MFAVFYKISLCYLKRKCKYIVQKWIWDELKIDLRNLLLIFLLLFSLIQAVIPPNTVDFIPLHNIHWEEFYLPCHTFQLQWIWYICEKLFTVVMQKGKNNVLESITCRICCVFGWKYRLYVWLKGKIAFVLILIYYIIFTQDLLKPFRIATQTHTFTFALSRMLRQHVLHWQRRSCNTKAICWEEITQIQN